MPQSPLHVAVDPVLVLARPVAVQHTADEGMLPLVHGGDGDPVVLLLLLPARVAGGGTAVPLAHTEPLNAAGRRLSLPGGVW